MRTDNVKWIIANNCGRNGKHSHLYSLGWKGKILELYIVSHKKMCPRKQNTDPKLLILVSFLSGEDTSYTNTIAIASTHIAGSMPFRFVWATLYKENNKLIRDTFDNLKI